ncbi:MAG: hypothetical protein EOO99_10310 [Pedobacter sp.]|nr:MAG: hypothetical protein EOO99_10310 [Pedobacter sp.]
MYSILKIKAATIVGLSLGCLALFSCTPESTTLSSHSYFDLNGFLDSEISRLKDKHNVIEKTININGLLETRVVKNADFEKELALFREGDINKNAWKDGFSNDSNDKFIQYLRIDDKIPVKLLRIEKNQQGIVGITIIIERKNLLYLTSDTLIYIPSKGYEIKKYQKLKIASPKTYSITGKYR